MRTLTVPRYSLPLWPRLTAGLHALAMSTVLAVSCLSALPSRPYDEALLDKPQHKRFVSNLQGVLATLGIATTRAQIRGHLIDGSESVIELRNRALAPLQRAFDLVGSRQQWGLFLQPGRTAYRLQILGRTRDGAWTLLYSAHEYDALGIGDMLEYRRLRGIYNPGKNASARGQYDGFVAWLARSVQAQWPEYRELRIAMRRISLGSRTEPSQQLGLELERTVVAGLP